MIKMATNGQKVLQRLVQPSPTRLTRSRSRLGHPAISIKFLWKAESEVKIKQK